MLSAIRSAGGKNACNMSFEYPFPFLSCAMYIEEVPAHTAILQDFAAAGLDFAPPRR
jgi:hypothetical protein